MALGLLICVTSCFWRELGKLPHSWMLTPFAQTSLGMLSLCRHCRQSFAVGACSAADLPFWAVISDLHLVFPSVYQISRSQIWNASHKARVLRIQCSRKKNEWCSSFSPTLYFLVFLQVKVREVTWLCAIHLASRKFTLWIQNWLQNSCNQEMVNLSLASPAILLVKTLDSRLGHHFLGVWKRGSVTSISLGVQALVRSHRVFWFQGQLSHHWVGASAHWLGLCPLDCYWFWSVSLIVQLWVLFLPCRELEIHDLVSPACILDY